MQEQDFIQQIVRHNHKLPNFVTLPPGDDMAEVTLNKPFLLVAADQIAQDIHFRVTPESSPELMRAIGHKALARNLSDIAAMAAKPLANLLSLMLPSWLSDEQITQLLEGYQSTSSKYECPLIGGDTGNWHDKNTDGKLVLSVTVLATPHEDIQAITRQGSQDGDGIYVTGVLGGSLIEKEGHPHMAHHLSFNPRLSLSQELAKTRKIHAMMDISDGIASDLKKLISGNSSELCAEINPENLPLSPAATLASQSSGQTPIEHALTDGEDYELLFTAPIESYRRLKEIGNHLFTPVTLIGKVLQADPQFRFKAANPCLAGTSTETGSLYLVQDDITKKPYERSGYEH